MTPAADRAALEADLDLGFVGLRLEASALQRRQLIDYLLLIERWSRVHNLTAVRDPAAMVTQHALDSLAVLAPLRLHLASEPAAAARLLDVGSGAGLPGVVLAIMEPALQVVCVDAVAKKAGFIRQVAGELTLPNLHTEHARVESLKAPPFNLVVSRAFSSLADFVALTRHLVSPSGAWMAMKGRVPSDEIAALPPEVEVFHVELLTVPGMDAERCLVWMRQRAAAPLH